MKRINRPFDIIPNAPKAAKLRQNPGMALRNYIYCVLCDDKQKLNSVSSVICAPERKIDPLSAASNCAIPDKDLWRKKKRAPLPRGRHSRTTGQISVPGPHPSAYRVMRRLLATILRSTRQRSRGAAFDTNTRRFHGPHRFESGTG